MPAAQATAKTLLPGLTLVLLTTAVVVTGAVRVTILVMAATPLPARTAVAELPIGTLMATWASGCLPTDDMLRLVCGVSWSQLCDWQPIWLVPHGASCARRARMFSGDI
jgi:hypothetical protein